MSSITFINMTPHAIVLHLEFGPTEIITFPPTGKVARAAERRISMGGIGHVGVERVEYGAVEGLPAPQPGVYYIVSGLVLQAAPDRPDLLAPGQPVRDKAGNIVGCKGWTTTPAFQPPQYVIDYSHAAKAAYEARKMRDD